MMFTIGDFAQAIGGMLPLDKAEEWDRNGLLAGDGAQLLGKVAVALDVTPRTIRSARDCGANVLLTHHPVYLEDPEGEDIGGVSLVSESLSMAEDLGIALVNFHTPLDLSVYAIEVLPDLLGVKPESVLVDCGESESGMTCGYGQVSPWPSVTSDELRNACLRAFGSSCRTWGPLDAVHHKVATWNGSFPREAIESCLSQGVTALICGEIKYHVALEAIALGLSCIEIGHDVSEYPYIPVLAQLCERAGVSRQDIIIIDNVVNWI